jgi:hypothetical protein
MGCSCKNKKNVDFLPNEEIILPKKKLIDEIKSYTSKTLLFLIVLLTTPIIMCVIVYYMFTTIVLTRNLDIKPFLIHLAKSMRKTIDAENEEEDDNDEEDDEDYDFLDEEDLIMLNVEDITNKDNK